MVVHEQYVKIFLLLKRKKLGIFLKDGHKNLVRPHKNRTEVNGLALHNYKKRSGPGIVYHTSYYMWLMGDRWKPSDYWILLK